MLLYATSDRPTLEGALCSLAACRTSGKTYTHYCFSTEPIAGQGSNVFCADVPMADVQKYEYTNEFHLDTATRFFAIPADFVPHMGLERTQFEEVTGNPWNVFTVPVLDRRVQKGSKSKGEWSLIWTSREGIASARVVKKEPDFLNPTQTGFMVVEVKLTVDFDPRRDYVMVEIHEEMEKEVGHSGIKETWRLFTIAGRTPQWAIFPTAWQNWVWDRAVTQSAVDYIVTHFPETREDAEFAVQKESKHNKARAWRNVADTVGRRLRLDLGKFASHSWTAVAAMPHRIAMRISQHWSDRPWVPPRPKPEFENPDTSGRILLANLYGAYPKMGPGVDHAPQDRPFIRKEGELETGGGPRPFELRQLTPAAR